MTRLTKSLIASRLALKLESWLSTTTSTTLRLGRGLTPMCLKKQAESADIKSAPFYCIQRKPLFIGLIPGIKVDEHCRVVNESGEEIGNLYAAGEVMYANVFGGTYPAFGSGVGTSCYTGAISARDALAALA